MTPIPTLDTPTPAKVHLIGGEKGGVGKSLVSRLLAQHFIDENIPFLGFDSDRSHGTLSRFYTGYASPLTVDRYEALDAVLEAAIEQPARRLLVDLAAQTHEPLVKWMDESGVLDLADLSGVALHYWHVMDAGKDSVDLLQRLLERFGRRLHYVIVRNHVRGDDFGLLERSGAQALAVSLGASVIDIKRLHETVVQKIDATSASFWLARNGGSRDGSGPALGLMERQRLKLWLAHVHGEFAKLAL